MRVVAGTAKSIPLRTPKGRDTRPTTDRIKETLFNILQPMLPGCRFLDLFAGSGAIGIEALSRGASYCVFVEKNREALSCIRENLRKTGLQGSADVLPQDVMRAMRHLEGQMSFDCVFLDPPYRGGLEPAVLMYLSSSSLLAPDGLIIVEALPDTDFSFLETMKLSIVREKKYKTNRHLFIRSMQGE